MPEVVYAKGDRTWEQVFPILEVEGNHEWRVIDSVLEAIAMNNRFGDKTPRQLRNWWIERVLEETEKLLEKEADPQKRLDIFRDCGVNLYYLDRVFRNLGGAYREYKSFAKS